MTDSNPVPDKTEKSTVEIYRPPPDPVVLWKRFASPHECDALLELAGGLPHLPALAAGAPQGTIRRSLSKALHWDHHPQLAAFQARMLAAAQNWTGEDRLDPSVLAIGEPMNLAAYLNPGDEYRSHCDGRCGARPSAQDRIDARRRRCDMLIFGYLVDGRISLEEHSACPVRRGQKWIATQWYRALATPVGQPPRRTPLVLSDIPEVPTREPSIKWEGELEWIYSRTKAYTAEEWEARFGPKNKQRTDENAHILVLGHTSDTLG
eukprot:g27935.t1